MSARQRLRAIRERMRRRVGCRDQWGCRGYLVPSPRTGGECGAVLETPYGRLTLSVLEAGRLREGLRDCVLESERLGNTADTRGEVSQ